ncbi:hypothetical protein AN5487.2 [Paecilomyces variotii No. 5]|uniref:DUF6594 domain-containing protein n=1 Tax=Byssochlamys spectabilis (strain No. 5 / NBRC 109023) TaxID=1356009 RepID=V5G255_BYSSN|nr:hypothetical protein AN5487.2 [Paecilomyces variotii No. 5]
MSSFDHRYDNLADFVRDYPRMAIVRSFRYLYFTRVFQLQAEIHALERESQYPSNAPSDSAQDASPAGQPSGSDLPKNITPYVDKLLKEYYELLSLGSQLQGLQLPKASDINFLRDSVIEPLLGGTGDDCPWDQDDLVFLFTNPNSEYDRFTSWVFDKLVFFHDYIGDFMNPDNTVPVEDAYTYNEETFASRVAVISVILAIIINVSSIYILYYTDNMQTRLRVIAIYTSLFAIMMTFSTNCQRAHIWPATATYAAMLVVFVGNNNSN